MPTFYCNYFFSLGTRGPLILGGPLDFAYPAYPIVTPLASNSNPSLKISPFLSLGSRGSYTSIYGFLSMVSYNHKLGYGDIKPQIFWGYNLDPVESLDYRSHDHWAWAMRFPIGCPFKPTDYCTSHDCWDTKLQRFRGYDLDLLGSRNVICHVVTIGLAIYGFL